MKFKKIDKYYIKDNKKSWERSVQGIGCQRIDMVNSIFPKFLIMKIISLISKTSLYKLFKTREIKFSYESDFDLLLNYEKDKMLAFDFKNNIMIKKFKNESLFYKDYYIRNLEEVKKISPSIIEWDIENKRYKEELIRGQRLNKANISKGKKVLRELWPKLYNLHKNNSVKKKITFKNDKAFLLTKNNFSNLDIMNWWKQTNEKEVHLGLIHGDLKQTNIIISNDGPIIIDWEEYFQKGLILTDILYFLYRLTLRYNAKKVISLYFANKDWILEPIDSYNKSLMRDNLVFFTYWLNKRYYKENQLEKNYKFENFINEIKLTFDL